MSVFVLDKRKKPLMPCSEGRAYRLLKKGRAIVVKRYPFTIRLKDRKVEDSVLQDVKLKIDPGSVTTGMAVVREGKKIKEGEVKLDVVLFLAELEHRGKLIKKRLESRDMYRKNRRGRNLRYRPARFLNRTKPKGWLPPSLRHRINTTMSWVKKLRKLVPIVSLSVELTKFDTQKMQKSNISGVEYQQGTLAGYEVREYLLEKWQRKCAYCGKEGVYMNIDHIQPKSKGGSDRVSNLCLSCVKCNHKKDNKLVEEFLKRKPELLARINRQRKVPLDDAAAMNATRNGLLRELEATGLPVEIGTGAETKWNRSKLGIPKGHAADAACVGKVEGLVGWGMKVFKIKAVGRGQYRRTNVYKSGFPRGYLTRNKVIYGFKTGDMVVARVSSGKYRGVWKGRVVVKKDGWFNIGKCCTLYDNCKLISYGNGYSYN